LTGKSKGTTEKKKKTALKNRDPKNVCALLGTGRTKTRRMASGLTNGHKEGKDRGRQMEDLSARQNSRNQQEKTGIHSLRRRTGSKRNGTNIWFHLPCGPNKTQKRKKKKKRKTKQTKKKKNKQKKKKKHKKHTNKKKKKKQKNPKTKKKKKNR